MHFILSISKLYCAFPLFLPLLQCLCIATQMNLNLFLQFFLSIPVKTVSWHLALMSSHLARGERGEKKQTKQNKQAKKPQNHCVTAVVHQREQVLHRSGWYNG